MIKIRPNTFETNSSSTHSLVLCMKEDYDKWVNNLVYLNLRTYPKSTSEYANKRFVTKEEIVDILEKTDCMYNEDYFQTFKNDEIGGCDDEDELCDFLTNNDFYTYDSFFDEYLEDFYT